MPTRILWLDAADSSTLTTDNSGNLVSWTSKEGSNYVARSVSTGFDQNPTIVSGTAGLPWVALYMSNTGRTLFAVPEQMATNDVLRSDDYGVTWQTVAFSLTTRLNQVAFSKTGQYVVATGDEDYLYVSTDYGATFTAKLTDATRSWEWCAISQSGQYVLASTFNDTVYRSGDYGATFSAVSALPTDSIDMGFVFIDNETGASQYAGYFGGNVLKSVDYGLTWNTVTSLPNNVQWYDMIQSVDSTTLVVWSNDGDIYSSKNGGSAWTNLTASLTKNWTTVKMSRDGGSIVAVQNPGLLYMSADGGTTWTTPIGNTVQYWTECAISLDGQNVIAGADKIYHSTDGGTTFVTDGTSISHFSVEIAQSENPVLSYSTYDGGVYVSRNTAPRVDLVESKQYVSLDSSQMVIDNIDLGSIFSMFFVYRPLDNKRGALWCMDDTHGFYPRDANTTVVGFGANTVTLDPSPVVLNKSQVGNVTTNGTNLSVYKNTQKTYDSSYTTTAAGGTSMLLGNNVSGNAFFNGYLGEIIAYDGALNQTDFNSLMNGFATKWAIPEAVPVVPGVGSDPHLMTVDGRRFDIMYPGWYTLLSLHSDFSIEFKVASLKLQHGLYIVQVRVKNGPYHALVNFAHRQVKWKKDYDSPIYQLEIDDSKDVSFDLHPKAPKRMVRVLHGYHTVLQDFWIYIDMKHRYIVPFFPSVKTYDVFNGVMVNPESDKTKIRTNWKGVDRSYIHLK